MVRLVQVKTVTILELEDRYDSLDEESLEVLTEALLEAASSESPPLLLLDLSNTRFIGSRFIGLLVRAWKRVRDRDGKMGLCCVPPFCQEALISTRLYDTLWAAYATREEAIESMVEQSPPNPS